MPAAAEAEMEEMDGNDRVPEDETEAAEDRSALWRYLRSVQQGPRLLRQEEERALGLRISAHIRACIDRICDELFRRRCRRPPKRPHQACLDCAHCRLAARFNPDRRGERTVRRKLVEAFESKEAPALLGEFGTPKARKDYHLMVTSNLRLVIDVARRFRRRVRLEDLIQEGNIGLMIAAAKFDARKGYKFSTYATWWIKHHIRRYLADKARNVRRPVHVHDFTSKQRHATAFLYNRLNRPPNDEEIADQMVRMYPPTKHETSERKEGWDRRESILKRIRGYRTQSNATDLSLDSSVHDGDSRLHLEFLTDDKAPNFLQEMERASVQERLSAAMERLDPRERAVVRQHCGLDGEERTLKDIGKDFGVCRERARQINDRALKKLKRMLLRQGIDSPC